MKLYIKQKVFSWRDRFIIKEENGNDRYTAEGEIFSWGRKLHVRGADGREAAFIHRKMLSFLSRYYIDIDGRTYTLVKEISFLKPRFTLEGVNWRVEGDFWAHEYSLVESGGVVMRMSKQWFTWGDSYELDIPDARNELLSLCVALAIDCVNADREDASRN